MYRDPLAGPIVRNSFHDKACRHVVNLTSDWNDMLYHVGASRSRCRFVYILHWSLKQLQKLQYQLAGSVQHNLSWST